FSTDNVHLRRHLYQRWGDVVGLRIGRGTDAFAEENTATLLPGGVERPLHGLEGGLINEGSHQGPGLQWIANVLGGNPVIGRFEALHQLVVDTDVGNDAANGRAALTTRSHGTKQNGRERHAEISLVTDDHRI